MPVPAKNPHGRPKRDRILAEMAFRMRCEGAPLQEIQSLLNAQGMMQLEDCGPKVKPYYRGARRWADSGEATLKQFKASEGRELMDLATRRALEAADLLMKIAAGQVPLFDAAGRVIPQKGETEEEADRRVSIGRALAMGGRRPRQTRDTKSVSVPRPARPPDPRRARRRPRPSAPLGEARRRPGRSRLEREADRAAAVVRSDREIYSDLESHLRGEVLRILTAAEPPIGRDDIAAELQLEEDALARVLYLLKAEGAIIGAPEGGTGSRFVYHVAP